MIDIPVLLYIAMLPNLLVLHVLTYSLATRTVWNTIHDKLLWQFFSPYTVTCPHFIPTTIFYSFMKDRKEKDYQGPKRQGSDRFVPVYRDTTDPPDSIR